MECITPISADIYSKQMSRFMFSITHCFTDVATESPFCAEGAIASMIQAMRSRLTDIFLASRNVLYTVDDTAHRSKVIHYGGHGQF